MFSFGIEFSIKHFFALLVRHSDWILNHLVRNGFVVVLDNRVIKASPYESHCGNPARAQLHISIVPWSVDVVMTTNYHVFSKLGFSVWLEAQMR